MSARKDATPKLRFMLRGKLAFLVAVLLSMVGFWIYFAYRVPLGLDAKGNGDENIAWIGLGTAIVSMITVLVGLIQKLIELRAPRGEDR